MIDRERGIDRERERESEKIVFITNDEKRWTVNDYEMETRTQ